MNNKARIEQLKKVQEELKKDKATQEKESRKAKFPALMQLAITAMRACRELTWSNKNSADTTKKAALMLSVSEATKAFVKAYREIVRNDLGRWWGAELQKAYIQDNSEALLVYYLSDNPDKTKPLAWSLKKAADEYIRGWEMLGKKNRTTLSGPIDVVGNGSLAVQMLIEQLKTGDEIQKAQAEIVEILFEDPIDALGKKPTEKAEPEGFILGETLSDGAAN